MGGMGPIPASSLLQWFERYGPSDLDDQATFRAVIRAMDNTALPLLNRRSGGQGIDSQINNPNTPPLTRDLFDAMFAPAKSLKKKVG